MNILSFGRVGLLLLGAFRSGRHAPLQCCVTAQIISQFVPAILRKGANKRNFNVVRNIVPPSEVSFKLKTPDFLVNCYQVAQFARVVRGVHANV